MSETTETAAAVQQLPPGMTVTTKTMNTNNIETVHHIVTFGSPPRTIEVVDLDMGAQFDLAEITGGAGDNLEYRNLAFVAASIRRIGDLPIPGMSFSKGTLRDVLRRLGADGVRAAGTVIAGFAGGPNSQPATESEHKAAVGN